MAVTRVFSLPILLLIAFYERGSVRGGPLRTWIGDLLLRVTLAMPAKWAEKLSMLEGAHWECEAVFEYSPSGDEKDDDEDEDVDEFGGGLTDTEDEMMDEAGGEAQGRGKLSGRASRIINRASRPEFQSKRLTSYGSAREGAATPVLSEEGSGGPRGRAVSGAGLGEVSSTVGSPTKPVTMPEPSTSRAKSPPLFPTIESEEEPSPPASPRALQTHRARFVSDDRHGHGHGHERLPSNATSAGDGPRRRKTRSPDHIGDSALSTSAPTRFDSPLARLYQPHSHEDRSSFAGPGGGGGGGGLSQSVGTSAGLNHSGLARRRTMSMIAPVGAGGAFSGRVGQNHGAGAGAEAVAEQLGQMRRMMEGLVGAVGRLEEEVRELKTGKDRVRDVGANDE